MLKPQGIFAEENNDALYTAIHNAAGAKNFDDNESVYDWLEHTPRASLTVELVDALGELGYEVAKKNTRTPDPAAVLREVRESIISLYDTHRDGSFKIPNSYDGDILRLFLSEFLNCPATPVYHCKAEDTSQMEPLRCVHCGKAVSTPVPTNTVVRAYIECPECISKRDGSGTEAHGEETTGVQIHHQKTCPRCGHDKHRGTWEDTTLAKCERCGHIWRAINICKEADHE